MRVLRTAATVTLSACVAAVGLACQAQAHGSGGRDGADHRLPRLLDDNRVSINSGDVTEGILAPLTHLGETEPPRHPRKGTAADGG